MSPFQLKRAFFLSFGYSWSRNFTSGRIQKEGMFFVCFCFLNLFLGSIFLVFPRKTTIPSIYIFIGVDTFSWLFVRKIVISLCVFIGNRYFL